MIGGVLGLVVGVLGAVLVTELALSGSGYVLPFPVGTLLLLLSRPLSQGSSRRSFLPASRKARRDGGAG